MRFNKTPEARQGTGSLKLSKSSSAPDMMAKTWHPTSMSAWGQGKLEPLKAAPQSESPKSQGSQKKKHKKIPKAVDEVSQELELEGTSSAALHEISTAALQVSEVMKDLLCTADSIGEQPEGYVNDLMFLREIGSSALQIAESLDAPMEKPTEDPIYSDVTLERAKRLAALSYELVEDIEMATDGYEDAAQNGNDEVKSLRNVSKATGHVIEEMQRLQGESWAAGVLAEILEEERRASLENGEEKEDEAVLQVVAEDSLLFDGEDPKIAKLLRRTLARVRGESSGFDEAEKEDLHAAFLRFKVPDSADIHKDDLDALLNFVGRWVPPEDGITEMARKITMYDYMDFDEFLTFMTYYDEFERAEQERIFKLYDQDSSGNISIAELRCLLSGLGMLTLRQMMQEALAVVDKNWDGELNFEELCCFLAVYRGSEGFTKEEVESLKSLFDSEAVQEEEKPGRHDLPPEPKLPGKHLPSLLIQAFGMQVADNVEELQQQLASGQGFRKTATTDSSESGSATISFKEFLILARRTREMEMMQLSKEMPGLMNTPARGSSGDFASADSDGNGTISAEELYQFLIGKEFTPLKKVVQEILQEAAAEALERSEGLDFNQFFDFLFIYRQRDGFAKAEVDRFRRGFNEYDQDGSGSISTLELSDIFRDFGYRISVETLHHYIDRVDEDGSNQLDFREFLRLMRWHRESELDSYKAIFDNYKVKQEGSEGIPRKKLKAAIEELGAIGDVSIIDAEVEKLPKEMPPVDFDVYVHAVDASRLEYVRQEKKKAGFTDEELQRYTESFQKIDRDGSGSIEGKELLKLLEAFGWEPRSKHEREVLLERLNTARKRAREAEAPKVSADDSPEFGYWEFIQLARELNTLHEKAKEQAMNQLMEEVQFNQKEVNQFHEVFLHWLHVDEDEETAEKAKQLDHSDAGLTRELVRRVVRNTGLSLGPERKEILDTRLDTLEEDGKLKFHGFLRLMRWILESDFGEINSHMQQQQKGEKH